MKDVFVTDKTGEGRSDDGAAGRDFGEAAWIRGKRIN